MPAPGREKFAVLFNADPHSAHSRVSGNPGIHSRAQKALALGPRFRGDERDSGKRATAPAMDKVLHAERLDGKAKRLHRRALDELPDGAMIALDGEAFAVRGNRLLRWTPSGYTQARPRPRAMQVDVLTPPSIVAVLKAGFHPLWHPSASGD